MESSDNTLQQLMFSLVKIWKSSGKTQKEFCQEKDITYHKFHYWFRKYNDQNSEPVDHSSFSRVIIKEKITPYAGSMEIVYPDGRKLIFHQQVEASFLRALLG